ncbi:MAG: aspartate--tRNA ligase [archaeon]|nr:aspartate--tRNA ligase [archaeon]
MRRTHTCGELKPSDIGSKVCLEGWVRFSRDHGGVAFIDLADRYGVTQVVFDPEDTPIGINVSALSNTLKTFTRESVISVNGIVRKRIAGTEDDRSSTGRVEVLITSAELLNKSAVPPFEIGDQKEGALPNEDIRLEYRYMDLRRTEMIHAIEFRSRFLHLARQYFESQNFLEIETPILARGTPEGARDYIVPSRINSGKFYALPQSPQLYKQMLMIAGLDRYYQIAKCFRDEDSRKDRQPEFTQLDIEMSFVDESDIQSYVENMLAYVWKGLYNRDLQTPFPRISYIEAMEKYGSDKPDLRYELQLENLTNIFKETNYEILRKIVADGGIVVGINVSHNILKEKIGRNDIDRYINLAKKFGLGGLTWARVVNGELESNIVKYFTSKNKIDIKNIMDAKNGDLIFLMAGPKRRTLEGAGLMRKQLATDLDLIPKNTFQFHWLVDCPMFEIDPISGKKDAFHHPFVLPYDNFKKGACFDILLNGNELGSGSMRINKPEIQIDVFHQIGLSDEEIEKNFGWFVKALGYGAPPHGGVAIGIDRIISILLNKETIRDTIAFPKNKKAQSLVDKSPSRIDSERLEELQLISMADDDADLPAIEEYTDEQLQG